MTNDIVEFVESTLGLELTEFQKKFLRTCYEHKDEMTEPLYLNVRRSNKKVFVEALRAVLAADLSNWTPTIIGPDKEGDTE